MIATEFDEQTGGQTPLFTIDRDSGERMPILDLVDSRYVLALPTGMTWIGVEDDAAPVRDRRLRIN